MQLIFGRQDEISGPAVVEEYRTRGGRGDTHVLDEAGHYPQLELPDTVARLWRAFVSSGRR